LLSLIRLEDRLLCAAAKRLLVPAALSLVKGLRSKKDQAKGRECQLVASSRQMESSVLRRVHDVLPAWGVLDGAPGCGRSEID
jgi:hypothetical protein